MLIVIQIQLLLKLNSYIILHCIVQFYIQIQLLLKLNKRTAIYSYKCKVIQIQLLLKLNARKISICDFHYTIKSIDIQGY